MEKQDFLLQLSLAYRSVSEGIAVSKQQPKFQKSFEFETKLLFLLKILNHDTRAATAWIRWKTLIKAEWKSIPSK